MKRILFPGLGTIWLLLMVLLLLPALVFTLRMRSAARGEAETASRESVLRIARLVAERHQRLMESTRQVLFVLCRLPAFQSGDLEACGRLCADLLQQYPRYANLGIAHLDGRIAACGLPLQHPADVAGRPWFLRLVRDPDLQAGDYHLDEMSGKPVVVMSHPVLDGSGRLKFIAFAALDLNWVLQIFDSARFPAGSVMTISDADGRILARTLDPGKWAGSSGPEADILKVLSPEREASAIGLGTDGVRRLYAVSPLRGAESQSTVYVSAGIPTAEVYAGAEQSTSRNLMILALTAALALAAMWAAGETYIGRGLRSLGEAVRRLKKGEQGARPVARTEAAELHEVARAFDEMAGALRARAETGERELSAAKESGARQGALIEQIRENERKLSAALEEAARKIAECAKSEEIIRDEVRHLKEALRATALENTQLGRKEEILRQREGAYKHCLESSVGEIARLKVALAETCEKLRQAEEQRTPGE